MNKSKINIPLIITCIGIAIIIAVIALIVVSKLPKKVNTEDIETLYQDDYGQHYEEYTEEDLENIVSLKYSLDDGKMTDEELINTYLDFVYINAKRKLNSNMVEVTINWTNDEAVDFLQDIEIYRNGVKINSNISDDKHIVTFSSTRNPEDYYYIAYGYNDFDVMRSSELIIIDEE